MPLSRFVVDALGVVTICLVAVLFLLGLFCILYSSYFRSRIRSQGFIQLGYFSGPWIIRIVFILFAIWWGFGEIVRLNLLRHNGRLLNALNLTWQENVCKCYIVSNLGFAEPCFFLTLAFLLRASLQKSGTLSRQWNGKTAAYVLLYCLPLFVLQVMVILIGPKFNKEKHSHKSPLGESTSSPGRNSASNRGSISFRAMEKAETSGAAFVELSLFSPSRHSTPPGSPRLLGWPMLPPAELVDPKS